MRWSDPSHPSQIETNEVAASFFVVCHRFKEGYNPFERRNDDEMPKVRF